MQRPRLPRAIRRHDREVLDLGAVGPRDRRAARGRQLDLGEKLRVQVGQRHRVNAGGRCHAELARSVGPRGRVSDGAAAGMGGDAVDDQIAADDRSRLRGSPTRARCILDGPRSATSVSSSRSPPSEGAGQTRERARLAGRGRVRPAPAARRRPRERRTRGCPRSNPSSICPAKATVFPSGEKAGKETRPLPFVSRRGRPPATGITHASLPELAVVAARGCGPTRTRSCSPSGENAGSSWSYSPRVIAWPIRSATSTRKRWRRPSCQPTPSRRAARPRRTRGALRSWAVALSRSSIPTRQTTTIRLESGAQASWLDRPGQIAEPCRHATVERRQPNVRSSGPRRPAEM